MYILRTYCCFFGKFIILPGVYAGLITKVDPTTTTNTTTTTTNTTNTNTTTTTTTGPVQFTAALLIELQT